MCHRDLPIHIYLYIPPASFALPVFRRSINFFFSPELPWHFIPSLIYRSPLLQQQRCTSLSLSPITFTGNFLYTYTTASDSTCAHGALLQWISEFLLNIYTTAHWWLRVIGRNSSDWIRNELILQHKATLFVNFEAPEAYRLLIFGNPTASVYTAWERRINHL